MSETDSFINEVNEEVRREKLYGYLRRYGWIAIAAVLLLVGGAAFVEYRAAQERAAAQATGDALLAALEVNDPAARADAMAGISSDGSSAAVTLLLQAATLEEAGNYDAAADALNRLAVNGEAPEMYRDLAAFKAAMLPTDDLDARKAALDTLAAPGRPFSLLAREQRAYLALAEGNQDEAMELLRQIVEDAGATRGLRERVQSLMVALGEPLPELVNQ
ncbi:tetratricopeptide repeat protein [Yoonia litorea]|uniref:Ancillary SecYEG translocon subunit/Cell division coordinator CpoB TPR domain-containing protein n=1 Tax=Yoonia litorea TaxID=1123755 RepID=A0A1I6LV37_9RHOB|nr:tetratricopeptide repeat protein [Yoonia litorea]SFS07309.1 hypothetical protein SAMN05444714_0923 [Yoonia litorea]